MFESVHSIVTKEHEPKDVKTDGVAPVGSLSISSEKPSRIVSYLDAPAGAGKTHAIITRINKIVDHGDRVILCQPTKLLIDETARRLNDAFPHVHREVIHSGTRDGSVASALTKYLQAPFPDPHVLIVTWEAFQRLEHFPNRKSWRLIIDEIPQAYDCFDEILPHTHSVITQHLRRLPLGDSDYSLVSSGNRREIRRIAENRDNDAGLEVVRSLAARLDSDYWHSFVLTASFERLLREKKNNENKRLTVFSFLKPSIFDGFRSVLIAGACFKDSILFKSFSQGDRVAFVEDREAAKTLRFTEHPNGETVTFMYTSEEPWSKRRRDSQKKKAWQAIIKAVAKEFADQEFVWQANKDISANVFDGALSTRLPQSPHGLNDYDGINNAAFLSAHNLTPQHAKFICEQLKISRDELDLAIHRQHAYQTILRISLRDPENVSLKKVIVPDLATAQWLSEQFPGSEVRYLDCGLGVSVSSKRGRPRKHECAASKTAAYREDHKKAIAELIQLLGTNKDKPEIKELFCDDNTLYNRNFVTSIHGSVFVDKNAKRPVWVITGLSNRDFEELLFIRWKMVFANKHDNVLISSAIYDPKKSEKTERGKENFIAAFGIWLDFDGGDLHPDTFANMYPDLRMTIFNTFSSTGESLRFRVYIPIDAILTYETYVEIVKLMKSELEGTGYGSKNQIGDKKHGLDESKLHPASLFFLPCQPKDPSGRYFRTFKNKGRKPLNVEAWLQKLEAAARKEAASTGEESFLGALSFLKRERNREGIEAARQLWRESQTRSGAGHDQFWLLAFRLRVHGCEEHELREILLEEADHANSRDERRGEIERNIQRVMERAIL